MAADKLNNPLLQELTEIIESGKEAVVSQVNQTLTLVYWQVGFKINRYLLKDERAEYAKNIVVTLSRELETQYGRDFTEKNVRRMIQFSKVFNDFKIVTTVSAKLSWSHFVEGLILEDHNARLFYAQKSTEKKWSKDMVRARFEHTTQIDALLDIN